MTTQTASGSSVAVDPFEAGRAAVAQALGGAAPGVGLGFLFVTPRAPLERVLAGARSVAPHVRFVASHTAGEFTERGLTHGGVAALLLSGEALTFEVAHGQGLAGDVEVVAAALAAPLAGALERARAVGRPLATTFLLVDSLGGTGDRLVKALQRRVRSFHQVVGGAAGDEGAFAATPVGTDAFVGTDAAVAVHLFGAAQPGVGVRHGLRPTTARMRVTRASGTTVHELDGRPAFEAYRDHARSQGVTLEPASAGRYLIHHELGVYFPDELHHARAPVGVGPAGELRLVAELEQGASVCILDGVPDNMVAAAKQAAEEARAGLKGRPAAGLLVFDCVCRGLILEAQFGREIDAIAQVFPGVPMAGFLTYGEIARTAGRLDGWHNTTCVVVALPAD